VNLRFTVRVLFSVTRSLKNTALRSEFPIYAQNLHASLKTPALPLKNPFLHSNLFISSILPSKIFIFSFKNEKAAPICSGTASIFKIIRLHLNHLLMFHLILLEHQCLLQIEMMILVHG
jgi:hypothetical protein